jgi:hypothetical protein
MRNYHVFLYMPCDYDLSDVSILHVHRTTKHNLKIHSGWRFVPPQLPLQTLPRTSLSRRTSNHTRFSLLNIHGPQILTPFQTPRPTLNRRRHRLQWRRRQRTRRRRVRDTKIGFVIRILDSQTVPTSERRIRTEARNGLCRLRHRRRRGQLLNRDVEYT